jgi:ribosomal protein S18 acetylase RimI-like enzyme
MNSQSSFSFQLVGAEDCHVIRPLWERLNQQHASYPTPFSSEIAARRFAARLEALRAKGSDWSLRVEIASAIPGGPPIGYCVSSLSSTRVGEVDSLFVSPEYRRRRIASTLLQHALDWLRDGGAVQQRVVVFHANEEAVAFYRRFGFLPRNIELERDVRDHAS